MFLYCKLQLNLTNRTQKRPIKSAMDVFRQHQAIGSCLFMQRRSPAGNKQQTDWFDCSYHVFCKLLTNINLFQGSSPSVRTQI